MGLDIYLYRVNKPNIDLSKPIKIKDLDEIPDICHISTDKLKDTEYYGKTLTKNGIITKVEYEYFKRQKFLKDYLLNEYYDVFLSEKMKKLNNKNCPIIYLSIFDPHTNKEIMENVRIDKMIFYKKYIDKEIKEELIFSLDEVAYQRKGLNEEGWDLLPENCSFCDDKDRIKKMCEIGNLGEEFIDNWIDDKTVFHPWW